MGTGWRRARSAFGLHACVSAASDPDDCSSFGNVQANVSNEHASRSLPHNQLNASTSPRSPSRFHLLRSSMRFSRGVCAICLESMKPGQGHALFTAECSHTFHFPCIASNVKHGNLVCPVCRANWKEVPWQAPINKAMEKRGGTPESAAIVRQSEEAARYHSPVLRTVEAPLVNSTGRRHNFSSEPAIFNDDEPLEGLSFHNEYGVSERVGIEEENSGRREVCFVKELQVTTYPEVRAMAFPEDRDRFTMFIQVKAPAASKHRIQRRSIRNRTVVDNAAAALLDPSCRAPLDLVTVLDVSGSMSGTKLALLKEAMSFIIRSLSSTDRLSVIAFSSTAKRVMPLKRMSEEGREAALHAVNSLVCAEGTNIEEGLRKGARVLQDRKERNPVASIMLLSDGESSNNPTTSRIAGSSSRHNKGRQGGEQCVEHGSTRYGHVQVPVHAFRVGEGSNAAFRYQFIESEEEPEADDTCSMRAAFAQCIGGLLSVVVQDVQVFVLVDEGLCIKIAKGGRIIDDCGRKAMVRMGDLYAEEKKEVVLELRVHRSWEQEKKNLCTSSGSSSSSSSVCSSSRRSNMKRLGNNDGGGTEEAVIGVVVYCTYKDPVSHQILQTPHMRVSLVATPTPARRRFPYPIIQEEEEEEEEVEHHGRLRDLSSKAVTAPAAHHHHQN